MGDGFVAGRFDAAGKRFRGMYGALFHDEILTWRAASENFTAEVGECTEFGEANLYLCTAI
jgi:hypothetical protein